MTVAAAPGNAAAAVLRLAHIAEEFGAVALAAEGRAVAERLADERFFVACVGQFKRGKSTLLNALVGTQALPMGVPPVTTVLTVLRHGQAIRAQVHFLDGTVSPIDFTDLAAYVDERRNAGNGKRVSLAEVFLPARLLVSGLCLVDTPGLGSVLAANTAATRAFIPHIDAALVVLGCDPPISGEEADLVAEIAREADRLIVVLNKADRVSPIELDEARRFTEDVLATRVGDAIVRVLEVSARERLAEGKPTREWNALENELARLSTAKNAMLGKAGERAILRLRNALQAEIAEREAALRRPLHASEARAAHLRHVLARSEQSLGDLPALLISTEAGLSRAFDEKRREFLAEALPTATAEVEAAIAAARAAAGASLRQVALREARTIAERQLRRFLQEAESAAARLYTEATERFVRLCNEFLAEAASQGAEGGPSLTAEAGFHEPRHFFFASLMSRTQSGPLVWIADTLGINRLARVRSHARRYLADLLDINAMRVINDFRDRVLESRRFLEGEVRRSLREAASAAERALQGAIEWQAAGAEAVAGELTRLEAKRLEIETIGLTPRSLPMPSSSPDTCGRSRIVSPKP